MKKIAPILIMMLICNCLFAVAVRSSNSIGQDRGVYNGQSEYVLETEGNQSRLYFKNELQWVSNTTMPEQGRMIIDTTYTDGSLSLKRWYENTQLVKESEGNQMRLYAYDEDGRLVKSTVKIDEQVVLMQFYTYDGISKSLNGILSITLEGSKAAYYGRDWFSYTQDDYFEKNTTYNNISVKETWKGEKKLSDVNVVEVSDGGFRIERETNGLMVEETYDAQGLLVSEIASSFQVEYRYNENLELIEEIRKTLDGKIYENSYEKGRLVLQTVWNSDVREKDIQYNADGTKIETLFVNGAPYCDITYASDGKRVLSIVYR